MAALLSGSVLSINGDRGGGRWVLYDAICDGDGFWFPAEEERSWGWGLGGGLKTERMG